MAFDVHANLAYTLVDTPPSPPTTGTTMGVRSGDGALFPTPPFNITVWPTGAPPLVSNAEIARVTARVGDQFTLLRAQENTVARPIQGGDQLAQTITAKVIRDIEVALEQGSGTNPPHHGVHETGGLDMITKLDATVLTSGVIDRARLPGGTVATDTPNVFTASQIILAVGASLMLADPTPAANARAFVLQSTGAQFRLDAVSDDGATVQTPVLRADRLGAVTMAGSLTASGGLATTPLNATQLLSGTVPDARLAATVARTNVPQTHTATPTFVDVNVTGQYTGAAETVLIGPTFARLTLRDMSQAVNVRQWSIVNQTAGLYVRALDDGYGLVATPLTLTRAGDVSVGRDLTVVRDLAVTRNLTALGAIGAGPLISAAVGDISCNRGNQTGVLFLGRGDRYLYWDGANYQLYGANVNVVSLTSGGAITAVGTIQAPYFRADASLPILIMNEQAAAADARRWQIQAQSSLLYFWAVTDGGGGQANMRMDRAANLWVSQLAATNVVSSGGVSAAGLLSLSGPIRERILQGSVSGGVIYLDLNQTMNWWVTLNQNVTGIYIIAVTDPWCQTIVLRITQDGAGGHSCTFGGVKMQEGWQMSQGAGKTDIIILWQDTSGWYGAPFGTNL